MVVSNVQVPKQPDTHSCGVIVLHAMENLLKFACISEYNRSILASIQAADVNYDDIIRPATILNYRRKISTVISTIFCHAVHVDEIANTCKVVCLL